MNLKVKLYSTSFLLHGLLLVLGIVFYQELGLWIIAVEAILLVSLFIFLWLIRKGLQPLEYIDILSSLLKEQEFTSRFSYLNQPDFDKLIEQFNIMLDRLHNERLKLGDRKHVFEKLMTESPIGVILLDYDNRVTECNDSATAFFHRIMRDRDEDIPASSITFSNLNKAFELSKIKINSQHLISSGDGQKLKIGHYQFRDRGFERSFFLIHEITSDILKSQKEAYEKLIRIMSHEVNNTIAITNSLLESCLNYKNELSQESKQDFDKAINVVINRSASLNQFMQGYSEIVKLPQPTKSLFNLTKLVESLMILFYSECNQHQIKFESILDKNLTVYADPHLIEQVLVNIIKNAIEAIQTRQSHGHKKIIRLELQNKPSGIQLKIQDSGCGISDDIKQHLFTPFFTTKESGQGVGLMLIDEILTLHSFPYKLANNHNDIGAFFRICFMGTDNAI